MSREVDVESMELDALALEYQGEYGSASGNLDVSDLINNPNASGVCCVFGPGFEEQLPDLGFFKVRPVVDYGSDPCVVRTDAIQSLAK